MRNELLYALVFSVVFFLSGLVFAVHQKNSGAIIISAAIILSAVSICIKLENLNKNK